VRDTAPEPPHAAAPASIVYSRSRTFTPQPAELERNRIMNPDSSDRAAAAYRMLRTQVLQRMTRTPGVRSPF